MDQQHDTRTGSPTARLARFAATARVTDFPATVTHAATRHLVDTLGAVVAGRDQPTLRGAAAVCAELGAAGPVPVIGLGTRMDALSAAGLMAISAHAIELDDGNREGSYHPGTVVVPAVAAAAWHLDASGEDVLAAVIAGYEVAGQVARALHPHASRRGFQNTPVVGTLGAAAAVGRLLHLDAGQMEQAIGVAASASGGIFAYLTGGGTVKKFHPGHAAREGILAALMVARGAVTGPLGVLETKAGVLQAFGGLDHWPDTAADPEGVPLVATGYLKPYPCCRHIHPAIDGLLALRREHGVEPDRVRAIEVGTYAVAMPHAALPWDEFVIAQLSFPYVMGVALRTGMVALSSFDDAARRDPGVLSDVAKVRVSVDAECDRNYPAQGPARVTLVLDDGSRLSTYVAQPLGAPAVPMSDAALEDKFRMMLAGWAGRAAQDTLLGGLHALPGLARWRALHAHFAAPAAA